ncbi:hypothetical protein SO802_006025 [Lithocarpus litseifolius]|uniref:TRF2/HOY1 PH-like domain-containing protein n=1 Tax=Lithocarpus litseifolius TaxID=425828 RepID=A0AAW2DK56_9ROSI
MVELTKKAVLEEVEKSSLELNKLSKHKHPSLQQKEMYNPFDHELSPLGLHLRKSPSLLDLIQIRLLSHQNTHNNNNNNDKLKASNFLASLLRIGTWEYKSKYEGELVAKCYFVKHKLVWEVLDGSLKNKIEIQWSDIVAIKAIYPDDGPGTLDVVLSRRPLFFRETNPQPRKHTLWQASSDFTGGQASVYRRHFLHCPQGVLDKHFEKLIQCDPHLSFLSQQPEIVLECPYFESNVAGFEEPNEYGSDMKSEETSLGAVASPSGAQSSFSTNEQDFIARAPENYIEETPSPSSELTAIAQDLRKIMVLLDSSTQKKDAQVPPKTTVETEVQVPIDDVSTFMQQEEHIIESTQEEKLQQVSEDVEGALDVEVDSDESGIESVMIHEVDEHLQVVEVQKVDTMVQNKIVLVQHIDFVFPEEFYGVMELNVILLSVLPRVIFGGKPKVHRRTNLGGKPRLSCITWPSDFFSMRRERLVE